MPLIPSSNSEDSNDSKDQTPNTFRERNNSSDGSIEDYPDIDELPPIFPGGNHNTSMHINDSHFPDINELPNNYPYQDDHDLSIVQLLPLTSSLSRTSNNDEHNKLQIARARALALANQNFRCSCLDCSSADSDMNYPLPRLQRQQVLYIFT